MNWIKSCDTGAKKLQIVFDLNAGSEMGGIDVHHHEAAQHEEHIDCERPIAEQRNVCVKQRGQLRERDGQVKEDNG